MPVAEMHGKIENSRHHYCTATHEQHILFIFLTDLEHCGKTTVTALLYFFFSLRETGYERRKERYLYDDPLDYFVFA